ncbi:MAG TPA: class I SAM-dependent methyltransferase [Micropepsaceae bacterium]|nr:class I SAM-dependent methyltransferase [Micropepsaceae bacterium]
MLGQLKSAHNMYCDRRLGIQTTADIRPPDTSLHRDSGKTSALGYSLIGRYIRLLRLQPSDVVYDVGCGTGRPLCLFARRRVRRCIGIEIDPTVAEIAKTNAANLVGRRAEITVIHGDAASSTDYQDGTVFWLYHPFGQRTLAAVLERVRKSVEASPRSVRFCYVTPDVEQAFSACGWLTRYKTVKPLLHPTSAASFWRN